ncbi:MAG: hypothetical protein J7647_27885 [Cyanobacteria bacterium SBLK]|nr:hypothetical protein [Cyanobacteria bacterium SBLK]
MNSLKEKIENKLDSLVETELYEVLDFVECLIKRKVEIQSPTTESPLLAIAGILSIEPLTSEEIEKELYGEGEIN